MRIELHSHRTTGRYSNGKRVWLFGRRGLRWLHVEIGRRAINLNWWLKGAA